MDDSQLTSIYNFRRLDDQVATAGQPTAEQLAAVAQAGFKTVISLRPDEPQHSLPDEAEIVRRLGMTFEHIPVVWNAPTHEDLEAFFAAMERHAGETVLVHCAANMRVSSFMFLYRVNRLDWRVADALPDLHALWQPNPTWQAFIDSQLQPE
jgi:uncharacterized protein (TIGR01244 family)